LKCDQIVLTIGYDIENLTNPEIRRKYHGEITTDHYGRSVPKHAHGTINIDHKTSSSKVITEHMILLFDRIINKDLLTRRINMVVCNLVDEDFVEIKPIIEQLDLFSDNSSKVDKKEKSLEDEKDEIILQNVLLDIKNKYGKNSILKGMNLEEGGTTIDRNGQIGGHRG
jgi:DNA polymerase V